MGSYKNYAAGHVTIDESWWENDGIVSVRSAQYPHEGSSNRCDLNYGTENGVMTFKDYLKRAFGTTSRRSKDSITSTWSARSQTRSIFRANSSRWLQCSQASLPTAGTPDTPDAPERVPFVDIVKGSFYYDAVVWGYNNGIVNGVDYELSRRMQSCTRAQVVTFLWRAAGSPEPKSMSTPFTTRKSGSFYEKAAAWAYEKRHRQGHDGNNVRAERNGNARSVCHLPVAL